MVGYLGYDMVRRLERAAAGDATDDLGLPELTMLLATDLAVVDHWEGSVAADRQRDSTTTRRRRRRRGVRGRGGPAGRDDQATWPRRPRRASRSTRPVPPAEYAVPHAGPGSTSRPSRRHWSASGPARSSRCRSGSGSRRRTDADALDVYRVLRTAEPVAVHVPAAARRLRHRRVVSPEALVTVDGGRAVLHPIAGTRSAATPRSGTPSWPPSWSPTSRSGPST